MSVRFDLGKHVATPGALAALQNAGQSPSPFLTRHAAGDWGDLPPEDVQANADALVNGCRVMSVYRLSDDTVIWIITEAADDEGRRSSTCILLPEEY